MVGCIDCGGKLRHEGGPEHMYVRRRHKDIQICHSCFIARMKGKTIEETEKAFDEIIDRAVTALKGVL